MGREPQAAGSPRGGGGGQLEQGKLGADVLPARRLSRAGGAGEMARCWYRKKYVYRVRAPEATYGSQRCWSSNRAVHLFVSWVTNPIRENMRNRRFRHSSNTFQKKQPSSHDCGSTIVFSFQSAKPWRLNRNFVFLLSSDVAVS